MIDKIVTMSKKDVGGDEVEGATMQVVDQDGNVVDKWTSGKEAHKIKNLEEGKTYTLKETVTADGYVKATDIEFTVTGADTEGEKENQHIDMIDKVVYFKKSDVKDGFVKGAQMSVKKLDGTVVDTWVSGDQKYQIKNLEEGQSYILTEEVAADGYVKATDIVFTVTGEKVNQSVKMIDKVVTNKKTTVSGNGLTGAELVVTDKDGNTVDSWVSDGKDYRIKNLKVGEKYTLTEAKAPIGYVKAAPIIFYVNEKAEDQAFELVDKQYTVSKKDINQEGVEGAELQVVDQDGNVVDKWTSSKEEHAISGLEEGKTYTLKETVTADGYVKATDIEFTVTGADTEGEKENQHIDMIDKIVTMSKKDVGGDEVEGATMQVVDQDGNVVDKWTSGKEAHKIKNLEEGKTYTLKETVTADGYVKATDIEFTVTGADSEGEKENQHIDMIDKIVNLLKVDMDGKVVSGALLQVIDEDGEIIDEWTTSEKSHNIEGLVAGKNYTIHEAEAPNGYSKVADTLLVVDDDFEDQAINLVDKTTNVYKIDQNTNAVTGAKMIAKVNGKTIDKWTTGKQIVDISAEVKADIETNGYSTWETEDAEYKIEANTSSRGSTFGKLLDFVFGKTVKDYRLQVLDKSGVSYYNVDIDGTETSHRVLGLSEKDEVTIVEKDIPEETENGVGYLKADGQTIVVSDSENTEAQVLDTKYDRIYIKKVDADTGKDLAGATLVLKDADGNIIEKWNSEEGAKAIDKLIVNETYTLEEVSAPDGYKVATPISFTVEDNGEDVQVITMKDDVEVPTGINHYHLVYGIIFFVAGGCLYLIRKKYR